MGLLRRTKTLKVKDTSKEMEIEQDMIGCNAQGSTKGMFSAGQHRCMLKGVSLLMSSHMCQRMSAVYIAQTEWM